MSKKVFTWLHHSLRSRQQAVMRHRAGRCLDMNIAALCAINIMDVKMAPVDAIWLFSVLSTCNVTCNVCAT